MGTPNQKNNEQNKPLKSINSYARYSSLGIQMGVIIFLGVVGGQKLDEKYPMKHPVFTIVCSLLSVFLALYIVLSGVLKIQKKKDEK